MASRLARLDRELFHEDRKELEDLSGKPISAVVNGLLDAIDPDKVLQKAKVEAKTDAPTEEQLKKTRTALAKEACKPFNEPKFRDTILAFRKRSEQIIDIISRDKVISYGFDDAAKEKARNVVPCSSFTARPMPAAILLTRK
jgi:type I restriction enzyme R subunit